MNALIPAIVAFVAVLAVSPANAETAAKKEVAADAAITTETTTETTAVETTTTTDTDAAAAMVAPENYTLEDGTSVVVEGGLVFTVDATGVRTPAPDGDWATKEGKTLKVLAGALVPEVTTTTETTTEVKTETTTEEAPAKAAE